MTVTAEKVQEAIDKICNYPNTPGGPADVFGVNWRVILPGYVLNAWFTPVQLCYVSDRYRPYKVALRQWYDQLKAEEETVTAIRGFYSIDEVVDSLAQCNDELENALSCVHHYKNNKLIMEQIDRLSRNYVALAVRVTKSADGDAFGPY